ncbi:MAG: hypothetical protein B7Y25_00400 [Alphaproteobacteria bacterium 16-39-46]|nr:MAG: hypothetical protein B7Y25_00400 [Alphaproteobacteria bacterium 16-39-46]OZA44437.1 MAG: hypothetical protein B7X84_00520 [Alphaproteobacteria bacterium 17-39-52]HQS83323.1 type II toxin-antitoxin system Phd/YefM family antitoxin [Alphaproteobacteria bacterium]HQS93642.1 type II toxin-antitoxin system Phd/YefM family antitoxin [Alphaproteobacteria bacterium]
METVSYTHLRNHLKSYLDMVCENHFPVKIERNSGDDCILLSGDDYASLVETMHLLGSLETTEKILKANKRRELYDLEEVKATLNL